MTLKFKLTLKSRATLKKMKEYEFPEIEPSILEEGRKRTHEDALIIKRHGTYFAIYSWKDKLHIQMLHSYDGFEEIKEGEKK